MKDNNNLKYVAYGVGTTPADGLTFMGIPLLVTRNKETAYALAQMSIIALIWLRTLDPQTPVKTVVDMLKDSRTKI